MTRKKFNKSQLIVIICSIAVLALICHYIVKPRDYILDVKTISWTSVIQIQEYTVVHEEGWSRPPSDAYNISHHSKKRKTEKHGNSSVDIYDTWYRYDINKWKDTHKVTAGGFDKNPYYAEYELKKSNRNDGIGDERESHRYIIYEVSGIQHNSSKSELITFEIPESIWKELQLTDEVNYKQRGFGKPYDIHIGK